MKKELVSLIGLINEKNEVLISLRKNSSKYNDYWEYPGGKVENKESLETALIREVKEELGLDIDETCIAPLAFSTEKHKKKETILFLYVCRKWDGEPIHLLGQKLAWVKPLNLGQFRMPPANIFLNSVLRDWV